MHFDDDDFVHDDEDAPNATPKTGQKLRAVPDPPSKDTSARRPACVTTVIDSWRKSGPLRHEPTGIEKLDEKTGGGPIYGSRWYLAGAPDAGKTALLIQIAHDFALRGIAVGLLAVDEEASDIVTRLAQRVGYLRLACELRDEFDLDDMTERLGGLPIRLYDDSWTIESAADDLAAFAKERAAADPESHPHGPRAFFGIDSLQTVSCMAESLANLEGREVPEATAVTMRVRAIRRKATAHGLIALATSELGRSAYSSRDKDKQTSTMAGSKWSGSVEYSARVLLGLRSVDGEKDVLDLEIAKNKHGPREEHIYLQIDRRSQIVSSSGYCPEPRDKESEDKRREEANEARNKERSRADGATVALVLASNPGVSVRDARALAMAQLGSGGTRMDLAFAALGKAVLRVPMPKGRFDLYLDGRLVPLNVLERMDDDARRTVSNSRPPSQQSEL